MKKIRIGMVCPYGWDTPGGVQTHIRDLADHLIEEGHYVSLDQLQALGRNNGLHQRILICCICMNLQFPPSHYLLVLPLRVR